MLSLEFSQDNETKHRPVALELCPGACLAYSSWNSSRVGLFARSIPSRKHVKPAFLFLVNFEHVPCLLLHYSNLPDLSTSWTDLNAFD